MRILRLTEIGEYERGSSFGIYYVQTNGELKTYLSTILPVNSAENTQVLDVTRETEFLKERKLYHDICKTFSILLKIHSVDWAYCCRLTRSDIDYSCKNQLLYYSLDAVRLLHKKLVRNIVGNQTNIVGSKRTRNFIRANQYRHYKKINRN